MLKIDELGRFDTRGGADFREPGRFKKRVSVGKGCPFGEMDNVMRRVFVVEDLIRPLAGCFAKVGRPVEYFSPGIVVDDLVDNQNVRHER